MQQEHPKMKPTEAITKRRILDLVRRYYAISFPADKFIPGRSRIPYGGRVFDEKEMVNLVDSALEFWLTAGRYAEEFEERMAAYLGVRHCLLTNSGSSANLLAVAALTSPKLGSDRLRKGDEVITVAAAFPTTVAPLIQHGLVPVFVDVTLPTYNVDTEMLEEARSRKTRAVILAHTIGNPFNVDRVKRFCDRQGLWLIEDNCDALGSKYKGRFTGTFGHIATQSFYPPHHVTMGEGGALFTNDPTLKRLIESFRDWGRDCWCPPGKDNTCGKRHRQQFGELPFGYDHKYVFSHFGFNLKVTDMQAAIGCAQLRKLPRFTEARKRNFQALYKAMEPYEDFFILPKATPGSDPSWFGFLLTVREGTRVCRDEIVAHLEKNRIQTRMLFAGNLLRHPCFDGMRNSRSGYRVVGDLRNTDAIMNRTFWVGVYPGISSSRRRYMIETFTEFLDGKKWEK
ncbi:MAG: lipopolysaccharide biosynthesis protein RfbH [candidate division Zixibacteria bacterium RBG_16_53_22]|nr:MAG: lipopolysaccharide biosynthesis protein RfbH [candidate division Zixibacteria bacterium RBG_16_53_22]